MKLHGISSTYVHTERRPRSNKNSLLYSFDLCEQTGDTNSVAMPKAKCLQPLSSETHFANSGKIDNKVDLGFSSDGAFVFAFAQCEKILNVQGFLSLDSLNPFKLETVSQT